MRDRVVITGMGVITPLGNSPQTLWQALLEGKSAVQEWPDLSAAGFRCTRACRIDDFQADPLRRGQAMLIAAAEQAIESARITPPADTGVFVGSTMGESFAFEAAAEGAAIDVSQYGVNSLALGVRRYFGLSGTVQSLATACAAGNYAVGSACDALRARQCDCALAGGSEPFSRLSLVGFSRSRAMAPEFCRPFDVRRNGMMLGEGAAVFMMERLDDALLRGAIPLAEVASLGLSCDAYHPTAPQPDGIGMASAMRSAIEQAGIEYSEIDWVNAHGTGTKSSDGAEAKAMHHVFGDNLPTVSASKGALGHALGAASAIELAVILLGLGAQVIPPTFGHETPEPELGITCTTQPVSKSLTWVLNNAFAFGGLNSSLLLRAWKPG